MSENEEFVLGECVTDRVRARTKKRTVVLSVRLTLEEFSHLEAVSRASGKTISQVARESIHEVRP